jgi:hypothetical protein
MLEVSMSVWPGAARVTQALSTSEGALLLISITVDPRRLESLLEALAQVGFPINPEICHDADLVYQHPDSREETESATLVEFPAYEDRLDDVRRAVEAFGFDPASVYATSMLEEIHGQPGSASARGGRRRRFLRIAER